MHPVWRLLTTYCILYKNIPVPLILTESAGIPLAVDYTHEEFSKIEPLLQSVCDSFTSENVMIDLADSNPIKYARQTGLNPLNTPEEVRAFVTTKLLEEADNDDGRTRIKALELLGKIGEVGLFVEKKEVIHKNYKEEDLDKILEEKLHLLLAENSIDGEVTKLDEEVQEVIEEVIEETNAEPSNT